MTAMIRRQADYLLLLWVRERKETRMIGGLRYRLCVAAFVVLAGFASAAWGEAIESAASIESTASLVISDVPWYQRIFCAYYEKAAKLSPSADEHATPMKPTERVTLAMDIGMAEGFQFAERAWLLYMLCDPSILPKEGGEAQSIAGGGEGWASHPDPEPKNESHLCYSEGLTLTFVSDPNAPDRLPWLSAVTLHIFKSAEAPYVLSAIWVGGPDAPSHDPSQWVMISLSSHELPVPDAQEMNRLLADPAVSRFCAPYLKACAASSDDEKASMAKDIAASRLSGQEKAFLLFKMLSAGMNADLAQRIAGASGACVAGHAPLLKVVSRGYYAEVVKEHDEVPMSMYTNGICLALSDKEPSTLIQANLKASRTAEGR